MQYVNFHKGASDNGNYNSRGSAGCITCNPDDATRIFNNFEWSNNGAGNTGTSSGTINIVRGNSTTRTNAVNALKVESGKIKQKNWNAQKATQRKQELQGHF
jgi:hypothetical protein